MFIEMHITFMEMFSRYRFLYYSLQLHLKQTQPKERNLTRIKYKAVIQK